MIKLVIFDIDGILTDAAIIVDSNGNEQKRVNLKDIDAVYELKARGFLLAAITGEATDMVKYFEKRFPWDFFYSGRKQKVEVIRELEKELGIEKQEICYIGDGKYDVEPIAYAGLGVCPGDAIYGAKQACDVILDKVGGDGCVWELLCILEKYNKRESHGDYLYNRLAEHTEIFKRMAADEKLEETLIHCSQKITEILLDGGRVFLCGNGGSAADAQHIAAEFVGRFYKERSGLNAEALTVNTSILTAIGNDYSFDKIFSRQLEAKARKNDMLICLSTSGKSTNILETLKFAKVNGIHTTLLMGCFAKTEAEQFADYLIKVPSQITPRIQEAHIFLGHVIAEYVEDKAVYCTQPGL